MASPNRLQITRTVWLLSWISLCTDLASEMIYPILPLYLESIGFSVAGIGLLEGIAQATAGLCKGWFGHWSDLRRQRTPFVRTGYLLSALAKPMMAIWASPVWVLLARTLDRLGKGIRTGARDALLASEASPQTRGRIFGLHRGMDTLGAAIGPGLALWFLWSHPAQYRSLFLLAFLPGLAAIALTWLLREKQARHSGPVSMPGFFHFLRYWKESNPAYRRLVAGLLAFALVNSSDLFLLLLLKSRGLSDAALIGWYIFYNLVYALAAFPLGGVADRWGLRPTFSGGLLLFAAVYAGFASASETWHFGVLFLLYGIYAAATEGVVKAWISNLSKAKDRGRAIGAYEGLRSVATLLASAGAGLVWQQFGPETLFFLTAGIVLTIAIYLSSIRLPGFVPDEK